MSPHAANSLITDLVEMAKASERLPIAELELSEARQDLHSKGDHIQRLELRAHEYKAEIEALHAAIRDLEVARDDAELRFLEADERTASALAFVRTVFGNAGSLIQALDPPRAVEPVVVVQSSPLPDAPLTPSSNEPVNEPQEAPVSPIGSQGQSDTTPMEPSSASDGEQTIGPASDPSPGPYANKRYIDHPGWVSRSDWLAGGGTDESYDWRESGQHVA